jgi:fibronectin type 3 domain-containing protein
VDFLLTLIVVAPPEAVDDLTATLSKTDIVLQWTAVTTDTSGGPLAVDLYRVYRDTLPDFTPGAPLDSTTGLMFTDDTGVVGDTGTNYYYVVTAVAGGEESAPSNEVGEFDIDLSTAP